MDTDQRTIEIVLKAQDANASIKEMAAGAAVMTAQLSRMGQDDPGRAQLLADLQAMNQRLTASRAEMRQVTQSAEELAAAEAEAAAAAEQLARANEETMATGQQATASLNQMRAAATLLERALADMSQDDPRRAALQQDFATLTQRIGTTTTAMRTQARSAEELAAAQEALVAENMRVVVEGQQVNATFNQLRASASQLEAQLGELSQDDPGRAQLLADYRALQQRIEAVRNEMGQAAPQANLFTQALGMAGVVVSVEAAVGVVGDMGKAIFETTSKFETYSAVMKNALGSESAAQLALHDIQTMAAKTPFSVDELTGSFIKFVNRGLKPSMEDMKKMADLAASQGKSFDQLAEAVLDAGTGEFERLKEFGIQASKSGDQVSLSFKGVQKTVANTPDAIQAAVLAFGEVNGVMGSTDAISNTLAGTTSNLGDTADTTALAWGQVLRPAFVAVLSTIGFLLGVLGAIPGFLVENRGALLALAGAVLTFNAPLLEANALLLYNAALSKGKVVWDWAVAASTKAWEIAQTGLNLALTANPIGAVIAVGTLLVGLLVMLWDKSEKFRGAVNGMGAALKAFVVTYVQGVIQQLTGLGNILAGVFTLDPEQIKKGLLEMGTSVKTMYYDAGKNAGAAFRQGYDEKIGTSKGQDFTQVLQAAMSAEAKRLDAVAKARQAAEAAARLEALKSQEAELKVRLAGVEEGTRQELKLKQQLLGVQAKIELEDAKKSEDEKRVVRAEAQDKIQDLETAFNAKLAKQREEERKRLAKLAEEEAKKALAVERSIQDLRVAAIANDHQRELAELDLQTARKIEALQGSEEQLTEQKLFLETAKQQKITELQAKWDEEAAKKKEEEAEKQAELNAAADEEYAAYLENKVANGLLAEQEYQEALYNLKKQALQDQLALTVKSHGAESAEAKKTRAEQLKLETDHVKKEKALKQDLKTFDLQMAAGKATILKEGLQLIEDNLDKQSTAYQLFKAARKTAELAELGINLQAELQANAKAAAENPLNGPTAGAAGATQLAVTNGLSIVRAVAAGIKIAAFAKGGPTDQLVNQVPLASLAGLLSGQSGGSLAPGGSFAGGGPVEQGTIGLIGEAGPELVIPNWMYADPKQANLMGFLEAQIASRGNAFAAGGSTTGASAVASSVSDDAGGQLVALMQQLVQGQQDFREEITEWQRNLVVQNNLSEVSNGLKVLQQVRKEGGIR
jgi:hypothetical protein